MKALKFVLAAATILGNLAAHSAFAAQATISVKERPSRTQNFDYVACRSTWLNDEKEVVIRQGNAPTIGVLIDGITQIRLMPNPISLGWGFANPENQRESIAIVASKSKDLNMFFDEQRGDSKIIGGFAITSTNRFQVDVTYNNQTFHLFCQALAL